MLSQFELRRLNSVFMLLSFTGLLPCDWDRRKSTMSTTRHKIKAPVHKVMAFGLVWVTLHFILGLSIDLYLHHLDAGQCFLQLTYLSAAVLVSATAVSIHAHPDQW